MRKGTPKLIRAAVEGKLWDKPFKRGRKDDNTRESDRTT